MKPEDQAEYEKRAAQMRAKWPEGPWSSEADRVEFEAHGFSCLILRQPRAGHLCGYVGVPPGHPWHGKDLASYEEGLPSPEVHGGVTYARGCEGTVCHIPKLGEPDDVWWIGFDCAHYGDFSPGRGDRQFPEESYRTVGYVRAECERLAKQAAEAARE